jgi:hypothetical protein
VPPSTRSVTERIAGLHHVVDLRLAQPLDNAASLERVNLGLFLVRDTDLGEQRGIGVHAVRNDRLGNATSQLFDDDLAPALALGPLIVGRELDPDGLHTGRGPQLQRNRAGRVKNTKVIFDESS